MQKAFVDTNVIIENILNKEFQNTFKSLADNHVLVVHEAVLFELGNLLKKMFGSRSASTMIQDIINTHPVYSHSFLDLKYALKIMEKYDFNKPNKDYTLTDAILLSCTEKEGCVLISMDKEMGFFKFEKGQFLMV